MLRFLHMHWANVLVCFVLYIVYMQFPAINWSYADDGHRWAYGLINNSEIINTHHLVFNVLREAFQLLQGVLGNLEPDIFLAKYAALFGVVGIVFLILLSHELGLRDVSILGAILCGVSTGYWSYSIVGDIYVPTVACILGATFFFLRGMSGEGAGKWAFGLCSAFLSVLAIVHHQAFFIFICGLGLQALFPRNASEPLISKLSYGIGVTCIAGLSSFAIYGVFFVTLQSEKDQSIVSFISGYAQNFVAYPDMKGFSPLSLVKSAAGFTRALVSTNILFQSDEFASLVQRMFPYRHMYSTVFIANEIPKSQAIIAWLTFGSTLMLSLILTLRGLWVLKYFPALVRLLGFAVIPQMLFFIWWESISDEFWIWVIPFWTLLILAGISRGKNIWRVLCVLLIVSLFCVSLIGTIVPYARQESDIDWMNSLFVEQLEERDMLISLDEIVISHRIRRLQSEHGFKYFTLFNSAAKGKELQLEKILHYAEQTIAEGGKVYIGPYLLQPPLSYLQLISLNTENFIVIRNDLVGGIQALGGDRVQLIYPEVVMLKYFDAPLSP